MPLAAGQILTHYEILGPLGAGGMGEVYRARDTRLEREVAIKVLPEELADDEERLRRFEGVDQEEDVCFLALELVPGDDLAARLSRGPLPVDEAVDVCRQIAEGLEAAHEAGVVHRDLKPANVRVTPEGVVKILDFGLAKPIRPKAGKAGTSTAESDSFLMTEEGLVLGTPTYMSPEQARGKPVDRRTDLWALGCVLYECLTGTRAFHGDSIPDIFAAIVEREPDWSKLPRGTPPAVSALLRRTLEKDPRTRLRDAGEARVLLEHVSSGSSLGWAGLTAGVAADSGAERRPTSTPILLFVVLLALLAGAAGRHVLWPSPAPEETASPAGRKERHFVVLDMRTMPEGIPFEADRMAVSPDGQRLAMPTSSGILIHSLDGLVPVLEPLPEDLGWERSVTWTPDSREVVYSAGGEIRRFAVPGGPHIVVADLDGEASDLNVVGETVIFDLDRDELLQRVPLRGGAREDFGEKPLEDSHIDALRRLPGTDRLLGIRHLNPVPSKLQAEQKWISIFGPDGERNLVEVELATENPCLVGGHIVVEVVGETSSLWAYPFSLDELAITGEPFFLWPGRDPRASHDGDLFYVHEDSPRRAQLAWLDRDGGLEPVDEIRTSVESPKFSPDGRRVAFLSSSSKEVWVYDVVKEKAALVAKLDDRAVFVHWLPDDRILVATAVGHLLLPNGPGDPVEWDVPGMVTWVAEDGSRALVSDFQTGQIAMQRLRDGMPDGELEVLQEKSSIFASMTRDGRWYLFASEQAGVKQYYVSRYPNTGEVWPTGVGTDSILSFGRDDEIVIFTWRGEMLEVMSFTPGPDPEFGPREPLRELEGLGMSLIPSYDPNRERYVVTKSIPPTDSRIVLVQDWRGPDEDR
jgi:serine/threonine-protein kinase